MRRCLLPLLACTAAVLAVPSGAGAITVAAGTQGRALMTWNTDAGLRFAERTAEGRFTSPATIAPPKSYPAFVSSGPGGSATVLAYDEAAGAPSELLLVSRPAGGHRLLGAVAFPLPPATHLLRVGDQRPRRQCAAAQALPRQPRPRDVGSRRAVRPAAGDRDLERDGRGRGRRRRSRRRGVLRLRDEGRPRAAWRGRLAARPGQAPEHEHLQRRRRGPRRQGQRDGRIRAHRRTPPLARRRARRPACWPRRALRPRSRRGARRSADRGRGLRIHAPCRGRLHHRARV